MAKKLKNKDERTSNIPVVKKEENKGAKVVTYKKDMTVGDFANELHVGLCEVIKKLMMAGIMASVNQVVDRETYELVALDFGYEYGMENKDVLGIDIFLSENNDSTNEAVLKSILHAKDPTNIVVSAYWDDVMDELRIPFYSSVLDSTDFGLVNHVS